MYGTVDDGPTVGRGGAAGDFEFIQIVIDDDELAVEVTSSMRTEICSECF